MNTAMKTYEDLLKDEMYQQIADRLVMRAGIAAKYKGAQTLADAVILFGTGHRRACAIYNMIGEYRGVTAKCVMREISYAIYRSPDVAKRLTEMLGIPICKDDVHGGLVISYLGMIFKDPGIAVYR